MADNIIHSVDVWAEIVESYQTGRSCVDTIKLLPHVKDIIRTVPADRHTPAPLHFVLNGKDALTTLPEQWLAFTIAYPHINVYLAISMP